MLAILVVLNTYYSLKFIKRTMVKKWPSSYITDRIVKFSKDVCFGILIEKIYYTYWKKI